MNFTAKERRLLKRLAKLGAMIEQARKACNGPNETFKHYIAVRDHVLPRMNDLLDGKIHKGMIRRAEELNYAMRSHARS